MEDSEIKKQLHQKEVDAIFRENIYDDLLNNRMKLAEGQNCPLCTKRKNGHSGKMRMMSGKYGSFLSCNLYPVCKFSWNTPQLSEDMETQKEKSKVNV